MLVSKLACPVMIEVTRMNVKTLQVKMSRRSLRTRG